MLQKAANGIDRPCRAAMRYPSAWEYPWIASHMNVGLEIASKLVRKLFVLDLLVVP